MNNPSLPTLLIATSNPGKRAEFERLLAGTMQIVTLDRTAARLPDEDGTDLAQIAATKATAAAEQTGLLTLADDSGLEVDALGGAPGARAARYAGEPPSDERNRNRLLAELRTIPAGLRMARFRCAVALARPSVIVATAEGTCEGSIAFAAAGSRGFGYDPVFLLPDGRTMAELTPDEKDRISHRARAYRSLWPRLMELLAVGA
jgi:XTP/dITP diphosphohydrolase